MAVFKASRKNTPKRTSLNHTPTKLPKAHVIYIYTSWWLNQPIWKICSSNWIISPIFGGENLRNIWVATTFVYKLILHPSQPFLGHHGLPWYLPSLFQFLNAADFHSFEATGFGHLSIFHTSWRPRRGPNVEVVLPSLKQTFSPLKIGWLEYYFPIGCRPMFRCKNAVSFREIKFQGMLLWFPSLCSAQFPQSCHHTTSSAWHNSRAGRSQEKHLKIHLQPLSPTKKDDQPTNHDRQ